MVAMKELTTQLDRVKSAGLEMVGSKTAKRLVLVYLGDIGSKTLNLLNTWLVIRLLSQHDYALFTIFFGFATLAASLVGGGVQMGIVRVAADYLNRHGIVPRQAYRFGLAAILVGFAAFSALVLSSSAELARIAYGTIEARDPILFALFYGFGFMLGEFARAVYQTEERFGFYVASLWVRQLATLVALVVLWRSSGLSFTEVAWALGIVSLIVGCVLVAWSGALKFDPDPGTGTALGRAELLRTLSWVVLYQVILVSFSQFDVMALSRFTDAEAVASYGVSFRYYVAGMMALSSVQAVLRPRFAKAENLTRKSLARFLKRWLSISMLLLIPLVAFGLFGRSAFVWINGTQYESSFDALRVLLFCVWQWLAFGPMTSILLGRDRYGTVVVLALASLLVSSSLNLLLVPGMREVGAAIATTCAYSTLNIGAFICVLRMSFGRVSEDGSGRPRTNGD